MGLLWWLASTFGSHGIAFALGILAIPGAIVFLCPEIVTIIYRESLYALRDASTLTLQASWWSRGYYSKAQSTRPPLRSLYLCWMESKRIVTRIVKRRRKRVNLPQVGSVVG
jgi:hypothetical protein